VGGGWRAAPWAGREHASVDRLVSVAFRFEFEGLAGQSESDPMIVRSESDPTIVQSHLIRDAHFEIESGEFFQRIRRAAGNRKSDRRTAAAMGQVQIARSVAAAADCFN
jgi:hypothetical protein